MIVTVQTKDMVEMMRARYKESGIKHEFLHYVAECGVFEHLKDNYVYKAIIHGVTPEDWDIHHKIPLSLGGGNDINNLALIYRRDHVALHEEIKPLIEDMKPGQERDIWLPMRTFYIDRLVNPGISRRER